MYIKPSAPGGIGAALEGSFRLWLASLARVWAFVFIPQLLSSLLILLRQSLAASLLSILVGLVSLAFYNGLMARMDDVAEQGALTFGAALQQGLGRWGAAFLALLIMTAAVAPLVILVALTGDGAGGSMPASTLPQMLLLVVYSLLMVYLFGRTFLALPVLVLERKPAWASIRASWTLTRGHWWRCAALLTVLSLATYAVFLLADLLLGVFGIPSGFRSNAAAVGTPAMLSLQAASLMLGTLTGPLFFAGFLILYYELKLRREGIDSSGSFTYTPRQEGDKPPQGSDVVNKNILALLAAVSACAAVRSPAADFPNPLPAETIPKVETLPAKYPTTWAFLNYAGDRIELRNVGSDSREVKGELQAHDSATLLVAEQRPELYVIDTVWSRGVRGARTDFITVYDKQTLNPVGEIVLPGGKRALITAMEGLTTFTDDQRMELVFNFTPASSVTVVDLVNRRVLGDIEIPGCSLVYPTGARGFSTLCASGTLLSIRLDAAGAVAGRAESRAFNPVDTDPLFTASATVGGIRYFPSLHGRIQPVDMRSDEVKILADWPLLTPAEAAAAWRPSGWQLLASDESKLLYVLMQADAHEGSHKDPANEVWIYNVASKTRIKRLRLVRPGSSIAITHGAEPLLLVQAGERLDAYDVRDGVLVRSMDLPGFRSRMQIETLR